MLVNVLEVGGGGGGGGVELKVAESVDRLVTISVSVRTDCRVTREETVSVFGVGRMIRVDTDTGL